MKTRKLKVIGNTDIAVIAIAKNLWKCLQLQYSIYLCIIFNDDRFGSVIYVINVELSLVLVGLLTHSWNKFFLRKS